MTTPIVKTYSTNGTTSRTLAESCEESLNSIVSMKGAAFTSTVIAAYRHESVAMITYYIDNDNALPRTFKVELPGDKLRTVYLLDDNHAMEPYETISPDNGYFTPAMEPNTVTVIR